MAKLKTLENSNLNAYFLPDTFVVDKIQEKQASVINEWYESFVNHKYNALYHLGFLDNEKWFSPSIEFLHRISSRIIKQISQEPDIEILKDKIDIKLTDEVINELIKSVPFVIGVEFIDSNWIMIICDAILSEFKHEIHAYDGTVTQYFSDNTSKLNIVGKVFFHLVENKNDEFPFAFMATYTTKPVKNKMAIHTPLRNALKEFEGDEKKLLQLIATVIKVADTSHFISELLSSGELFYPIKLTKDEAYIILKEMTSYEEAGILCRVPDWWRKQNSSVRISVNIGEKEPSKVGFDALFEFSPILEIDGQIISEEEIKMLIEMAEGLTLYKGKWIEVNQDKLKQALEAFEKVKEVEAGDGLTLKEAMRLELNLTHILDSMDQDIDISVTNGHWLNNLKESLIHPELIEKIKVEKSFIAKLRHYQFDGYQWLNQMTKLGLGACLADDMGLGKTIQMIAYLEYKRLHQYGKVLLIIPTSLLGNWKKEIEKFAPGMDFQILHKSEKNNKELGVYDNTFLTITTYGMALRLESLKTIEWDCVILDEAQAIKNPGSKQAKQIKLIPAKMRIALTGTPIENRLEELWSLFDFLNQGLLGTPNEFSQFVKSLSDNAMGYTKLRNLIRPFMLRRLKTDKSVIKDLPDKIEIGEYTTLTSKQIVLYKQLLEQIENKLNDVDGMERKGLILSSISKFKQICNHPDHYLSREEYRPDYSGKFEKLRELCETIYEKRERVIIFTQFREITEPLSDFLATIFNQKGFVLHGGTSVKHRTEMVEQFNAEHYIPYMVLSLKAGGVGLNLTSANHVIHFDRWWNPAVENQATDRAFRIGQKKNVMVYKFITQGTIEEKIDVIIQDKLKLSTDILSSGNEQWITEYSNDELLKLFSLGGQ